ncbi:MULTISPECIES: ATP-binding protein [Microcoleus]|uniref:ATP-binding protein n=1 Tax=Microcoleus TaxID=44471 RepID=UPI0016841BEC|nr:HAMP domain-containing protein [Microcoleus sp. FACHB-84]MBD2008296.1 HAMP domain-containing protein [Microcoleus sp. FACHB-45]
MSLTLALKNQLQNPPQIGVKSLLGRLGIRQKIGCGYALVLGIAVLGAVAGRGVESYHKQQVREKLAIDREKAEILTNLNNTVQEVRIQQQELASLTAKPQIFDRQRSEFLTRVAQMSGILEQLQAPSQTKNPEIAKDYQQLQQFAQVNGKTVESYFQQVQKMLATAKLSALNPKQQQALGQNLNNFVAGETALKLKEFSEDSAQLAGQFREKADEAFRTYENAEKLGTLILVGSLLISGAIAAILAAYTSGAIARSLEATTLIAQRVTEESNFDLQVPVTTSDEVGMLAISLNELIQRVAEYTEELHEAKVAAEAANRSKSAFLANMSHELRTPLNAIINYSEMLQEDAQDSGSEDFLPDLEKIQTAGKHLLDMISDILDISKIEAGHVTLYLENFDVATMIEEVMTTAQPLVEKKGNALALKTKGELGTMYADQPKVRQILLNLLSNAAKFTEKGVITIGVERIIIEKSRPAKQNKNNDFYSGSNYSSQVLIFRVSDTGIGMTNEQLEQIFKPFIQADASTTRKYGGTGLGLTISQRLCQILGGEISVESEDGKGSTFIVSLPERVVMQA